MAILEALVQSNSQGQISGSPKQIYLRKYYRNHRAFQTVTDEELQRCRKRLSLAREIRGPEWIACLECGLLLKKLPQHLIAEHNYSDRSVGEDYRRKWGLNRNSPLSSAAVCSKLSDQKRLTGQVPPTETRFGSKLGPQSAQGVAGREKWGTSKEATQAMRATMLQNPDRWLKNSDGKSALWQLAQERVGGREYQDIAKHFKQTPANVRIRLRRIGFPPGRPCIFYRGGPMTRRSLLSFCEDWITVNRRQGSTSITDAKDEIAATLRITRHELHRLVAHRDLDRPLSNEIADRVHVLWGTLKSRRQTQGAIRTGGRPVKLLPSELAELVSTYRSLRTDLGALRSAIDTSVVTSRSSFGSWACERARLGLGSMFLFWPTLVTWLFARSGKGRPSLAGRPSEIAMEFLAQEYQVSEDTIRKRVR
jgi:hypothetical protein